MLNYGMPITEKILRLTSGAMQIENWPKSIILVLFLWEALRLNSNSGNLDI